jgi:hypothetical protein
MNIVERLREIANRVAADGEFCPAGKVLMLVKELRSIADRCLRAGITEVPEIKVYTAPQWSQDAAREICDSFTPKTPRLQSEFVAEIIANHARKADLVNRLHIMGYCDWHTGNHWQQPDCRNFHEMI